MMVCFCVKAWSHVDMIGPEGLNNGMREEQERRDRENSQGNTPEECGRAMKDAVDRAIRDSERKDRSDRNKDRGDRGGDRGSKGDSDRSGGGRRR